MKKSKLISTINILFLLVFNISVGQSEIVTATIYNAVPQQCNADVQHTAFMFKLDLDNPYKHRIIAVSRDLLKDFPNKSKVMVSGTGKYDGVWVVRDKMNKRYTKRIDFLVNREVRLGKWSGVRIVRVE